ncbi:hypothetical protein RI367_007511 [Sorochytrium milnesiophthora]
MSTKPATAGGKAKGKGKGKKPTKKQLEEQARAEAAQRKLIHLRDLRTRYTAQTRLFLRDPIASVAAAIDSAIAGLEDVDKLVLAKIALAASDLWALHTAFESYAYLTTLSMWMIRMDDKTVTVLCTFIEKSPSLAHVFLIDNGIGVAQANTMAALLSRTAKLATLVLDYNPIGGAGANAIFKALSRDTTVQDPSAVLPVKPTPASPTAKAPALPSPPPLPPPSCLGITKLSLKFCELDQTCGPALEQLLRANKTILELDLSGNALHTTAFYHVAIGLQFNRSLQKLNLSSNNIMPQPVRVPCGARVGKTAVTPAETASPKLDESKAPSQGSLVGNLLGSPAKTSSSRLSLTLSRSPSGLVDTTAAAAALSAEDSAPVGRNANYHLRDGVAPDRRMAPEDMRGHERPPRDDCGDDAGSTSTTLQSHVPDHLDTSIQLLLAALQYASAPSAAAAAAAQPSVALHGPPLLTSVDLRQNAINESAATAILDALKFRKQQIQACAPTATPAGMVASPVPALSVWVTERLRSAVFVKILEINKWMDTLHKKRTAKKKARKKGTGKKAK